MFLDVRVVKARARFRGYRCAFYESVVLPMEFIDFVYSREYREFSKAFSQWRVDFPKPKNPASLSDTEKVLIAVLEKIIMRGRFTLASPYLEESFRKVFIGSKKLEVSLLKSAAGAIKSPVKRFHLDSEREEKFYFQIMPQVFGAASSWFVHPQVDLYTLTKDEKLKEQRVDFLIAHPQLKRPIVVEIDGAHHSKTKVHDRKRDKLLMLNGYDVIRVSKRDVERKLLMSFEELKKYINSVSGCKTQKDACRFLYALKIAHQVQATVILALKNGTLRVKDLAELQVISDIHELGLFTYKESLYIMRKAVSDFANLFRKVAKLLFDVDAELGFVPVLASEQPCMDTNAIFISFSDEVTLGVPTFYVRNVYFPFSFSFSPISTPSYKLQREPSKKELEFFLRYIFRKKSFWEGQYESVARILQGKDTLTILPTGGGKSMIYQLSSMLLPGVTFVVDPIISLMDDQVYNLRTMGIDRALALHSNLDPEEKSLAQNLFAAGNYIFVFISPERLRIEDFRTMLKSMTAKQPVPMIVVDEVHCVSEWGHDFRPSYLSIARFSKNIFGSNCPPLLGLTGTASNVVLKDVMRILEVSNEALVTPRSFDRKELEFQVIKCNSPDKLEELIKCLKQTLPAKFNSKEDDLFKPIGEETCSGIIFCPFVNGNYGVSNVREVLKLHGIDAAIYSGKAPKGVPAEEFKKQKVEAMFAFKENKVPVMVATKSFGMGIDKPNIRYVIHYSPPQSIEQYYQEVGRAGRDKKKAYAFLLLYLAKGWETYLSRPEYAGYKRIHDDLDKLFWFHKQSFKGKHVEITNIRSVLDKLGDITKAGECELSLTNDDTEKNRHTSPVLLGSLKDVEKAVYHLSKLGIVEDYLVDYGASSIKVRLSGAGKDEIVASYVDYVKSYLPGREQAELRKISTFYSDTISFREFVEKMVELLVNFVYDTIERQKRRMMREMLIAASHSKDGEEFRKRIIDYLETVEYTEDIEAMLKDMRMMRYICGKIVSNVLKPKDAQRLRGQVSRYLESYPDHPGLLILRSLSEFYVEPSNITLVFNELQKAIDYSLNDFNLDSDTVSDLIAWAISVIKNEENEHEVEELLIDLVNDVQDVDFLIAFPKYLPEDLKWVPAWRVLEILSLKAKSVVGMGVRT